MSPKNKAAKKPDPGNIMQIFRNRTRDAHATVESLPFFEALKHQKLPLPSYVNQLKALSIIHAVLENEISNSTHEALSAVWDDKMRKLLWIEQDLDFFQARIIPDAPMPVESALSTARSIRLRGIENPVSLLGYLYVFEGATLGNQQHLPDVTGTFKLEQNIGCRYYTGYADQTRNHWDLFGRKMDRAFEESSLHETVVVAALEAFTQLETLYNLLFPLKEGKKRLHITQINPEAGNHPVPDDEAEIRAALNASKRAWEMFPYYAHRFGERGKRFSDSDSCWLVTLTKLDINALKNQIGWLCRVLATRGMPTFMMEQELMILHEELMKEAPHKKDSWKKLLAAAKHLENTRLGQINTDAFNALADEFDLAVGDKAVGTYKNTGKLIISAVVDENNGINGSVDALTEWLTDSERFSNRWISTVKEIIKKANCLLKGE